MKIWFKCSCLNYVYVELKEHKGIPYVHCPVCGVITGLRPKHEFGFTGYGDRDWMNSLTEKLIIQNGKTRTKSRNRRVCRRS